MTPQDFIQQVERCVGLRTTGLLTDKEFADTVTEQFHQLQKYLPRNDAERAAFKEYGVAGVITVRANMTHAGWTPEDDDEDRID